LTADGGPDPPAVNYEPSGRDADEAGYFAIFIFEHQ
jgi:hypothetical protein